MSVLRVRTLDVHIICSKKTPKCREKFGRAPLWLPHTSTLFLKLSLKITKVKVKGFLLPHPLRFFLSQSMDRSAVRDQSDYECSLQQRLDAEAIAAVLTQLEVEEHTPRLSRSLSLLVSHGVLSLLGNTEVYCSVLVSRLSLSFSTPPPSSSTSYSLPLSVHNPLLRQWGSLCSAYHPSPPSVLLSSPLLPSSLSFRPSNGILYLTACTVHSGLCHDPANKIAKSAAALFCSYNQAREMSFHSYSS